MLVTLTFHDGVGDDGASVGGCAHPHVSSWFPPSRFLVCTCPECGPHRLRHFPPSLPHHGNVLRCHGGAIHKDTTVASGAPTVAVPTLIS